MVLQRRLYAMKVNIDWDLYLLAITCELLRLTINMWNNPRTIVRKFNLEPQKPNINFRTRRIFIVSNFLNVLYTDRIKTWASYPTRPYKTYLAYNVIII